MSIEQKIKLLELNIMNHDDETDSQISENIQNTCTHNLYYIKDINDKAILECIFCTEEREITNIDELERMHKENQLIGYDKRKIFPFVKVSDYLGLDAKYIIQTKYIEVCSQIMNLKDELKKSGYEKYIYLIKTPEEVITKYFEEALENIKQNPKYFKVNSKRKYL